MEGANGNSGMSKKIKIEAHFSNEAENKERKIELNLGLSMNGRFGVDPSTANKLKRCCSLTNLPADAPRGAARGDHSREDARGGHAPLPRASSLPSEAEEVWGGLRRQGKERAAAAEVWGGLGRPLKELAAAEARKRRMEKMKGARVVKAENWGSGLHESRKGGVDLEFADNDGVVNGSGNPVRVQSTEGSIGSQMGSAGSLVPQVPALMVMGGANHNNTMSSGSSSRQIPNSNGVPRSAAREDRQRLLENAMLNMPHVATKGEGEGASRIEGILYKYARADELKIVCACHGYFLSPAEFVRHGGGGDVAQPLRHILVNPCPLFQA